MSDVTCIAHKREHGIQLRCMRPHHHKGRHRWARDDAIYPLGRLDPDDPFDQMFVEAWNKGVSKASKART